MINELHISDANYNWSDSDFTLCNNSNLDKLIADKHWINCWTSPEDLGFDAIHKAVQSATQIDIAKLNLHNWSFDSFDTHGRLLNELFKNQHKVNQSLSKFLIKIPPVEKSTRKSLWTYGCSITWGYGVDINERFGKILADKLQLEEKCLAQPGTSVFWSADKILRSDLQAGDIVVWGLTNVARCEIAKDWLFKPVCAGDYDKLPVEDQLCNINYFSSPTQTLQALHLIDQVQNFCAKAEAKLIIVNVLDISWMSVLCNQYSNFKDLLDKRSISKNKVDYIDYGQDNLHPGPQQHKQWADDIFDFLHAQI